MPRLAPTNWQTQMKIFEEFGCRFVRQKGDYLIYHYPTARRAVVIPQYDEIPVTIIKNNMNTVGMSREEYFRLLTEV